MTKNAREMLHRTSLPNAPKKPSSREATLAELCRALKEQFALIRGRVQTAESGLAVDPFVGDIVDGASQEQCFGTEGAIALVEGATLTQMMRALQRDREGKYGECEGCGSAIPLERMRANKAATMCVQCASKAERSGARSAGEEAPDFRLAIEFEEAAMTGLDEDRMEKVEAPEEREPGKGKGGKKAKKR